MFTVYSAAVTGVPGNCIYPTTHKITDEAALKAAVSQDYVCAEYKNSYRSGENFIRSDCLCLDVDNDQADDLSGSITPEDVRNAFPGAEVAFHFSRNHMKTKNCKAAVPRFHVLFAIDEVVDAEVYAAMKRRVYDLFPYFDSNALDVARFFFGTKDPQVEYYPGKKLNEVFDLNVGDAGAGARSQCGGVAQKGTSAFAPTSPFALKRETGKLSERGDGERSQCGEAARKGADPFARAGASALNGGSDSYNAVSLPVGERDGFHPGASLSSGEKGRIIPAGQRNTTMYSFAVKILKRFGETERATELFLEEAECCSPPLESEELANIWNSAVKFYRKKVLTDPSYVPPEEYGSEFEALSLKPEDYSDIGEAKILVRECKDELCFTEATDFLRYNGKHWEESRQLAVGCVQAFLDLQLADAEDQLSSAVQELMDLGEKADAISPAKKYTDKLASSGNEKMAAAGRRLASALVYKSFVMQRRDARYVKATMDMAKPLVQLHVSNLDKNEFLLNTPEGTYDLRLGMAGMQPQDPADHITKMTAVSPSEKGKDIWLKALDTFFCGDDDLIRYVQQTMGLAAVGKVFQEAIVIAYGAGKNGKSSALNTIARVLGSYAGNMSADTLTVGCKRNVKPEMAELKGKRLVIASELEEGMRLNTAMVKQLCSTDEIFAEKKYKDPFSFTPSHTLVLFTNHLPRVGASDAGTWRRIIVIPFNAKIEGKSDIRNYADHLFHEAGEYILQWIIEGAQEVIRNHYVIDLPQCVKDAIQAYRDNNDWFSNFLDDCCEVDKSYTQKSGELYVEYRAHCARNGEYTRSTADFYTALENAGFERKKTNQGSFIFGLRIKDDFKVVS